MSQHDIAPLLATAQAHLAALDPRWKRLIDRVGDSRLTTEQNRSPFEALSRAVAFQQLHGKAASAIVGRLVERFPGQTFPTPAQLAALADEELRRCGFSARKAATLKAIADAAVKGQIPTRDAAVAMDDEALIERFTALKGIGRWTVEMLLIHTLGRADILPVDDFGVRDGARYLFAWQRMPTPTETRRLCEPCRPYRSVASWYLWRCNELSDYRRLERAK